MRTNINIKSGKKCAFCKYWYDPTNQYISPKAPNINVWEYEKNVKCKCLKKNLEMYSTNACSYYECKVPIV